MVPPPPKKKLGRVTLNYIDIFFLASYQLLLVSADNGCAKRTANQLMQPPSYLFTPISLCKVAPSPKKYCGKRDFFFEGRGCCTQARAHSTWLPPAQCNEEQCSLTNARIHKKATSISSLATFVMRIIVPVIPSVFGDKWVQLSDRKERITRSWLSHLVITGAT